MKSVLTTLTVFFTIAATIAAAVLHGRYTNRWGTPAEYDSVGDRIQQVPRQIGDWVCESNEEFPESVVEMLRCAGYVSRTYVNRRTGDSVQLALLAGPPGPIAAHTPEICYPARQYKANEGRQRRAIRSADDVESEFWRTKFIGQSERVENLEVWYAWSDGGRWLAPDEPRVSFWQASLLYKMQLATPWREADSRRIIADFLKAALPVIDPRISQGAGRRLTEPVDS